MRIIRFVLGRIILFLDWITSPKPIKMQQEQLDQITRSTSNMTLYEFRACPFCVRVRRFMRRNNIDIETKDARRNDDFASELISGGGKLQVPCLQIKEPSGKIVWIYESKDIIQFLTTELGFQT
ncbi:MAG: glutaredoxin [Spirochaetales bacterium]|nr:glutaredoxin [Spirochaetales bacterium]